MNQVLKRKRLSANAYAEGIRAGDRIMLSKAITIVESTLPADRIIAEELIHKLLPRTGVSLRIGISGVPGAGKSSFIETFGSLLISLGKKLAVLSIDPSSHRTGGSIMGDKTRMETLSNHPAAFVRPSASGGSSGGVHSNTREALMLCEAAGYDVIIIETVGVGQNEVSVRSMVDFFLLLLVAGAGDELQGIKRGVVEVADAIAINKADGDNVYRAEGARVAYKNALHLLAAAESGWTPEVVSCSAKTSNGIKEIWEMICRYEKQMKESGWFMRQRQAQQLRWMHDMIDYQLRQSFYENVEMQQVISSKEYQVSNGERTAIAAANELMRQFAEGGKCFYHSGSSSQSSMP